MENFNLTDDTFEKEVMQSNIPVLVDFWAEWCGPCKMLTPIIEELKTELQGKVKVCKMDIEASPNTPSKFGIRSIPTIMLFKDGKQISSKVGVSSKAAIKEWIDSQTR